MTASRFSPVSGALSISTLRGLHGRKETDPVPKNESRPTRVVASPRPEKRSPKVEAEARKTMKATLEKIKQNGKAPKPKPKFNGKWGYEY